jgi:osmotically-inducible protein OsmY
MAGGRRSGEQRAPCGVLLCLALWTAHPVTAGAAPLAAWEVTARDVRDHLRADPILRHEDIRVSASGLVLALSGRVRSREADQRAVSIARRFAAPHMVVTDDLRVEETPSSDLLAASVADRLAREGRPAVAVAMEGAVAVITGVVPTEAERRRLVEIAHGTPGVAAVIDQIEVHPPADGSADRP